MHDPRSSYAAAYLLIRMLPSLRDKRFRRRDILSVVNRLPYGAGARAAPQTRKIIDVPTTSIIDYVLDGLRLVKSDRDATVIRLFAMNVGGQPRHVIEGDG